MKKRRMILLTLIVSLMMALPVWADEMPEGMEIQHPEGLSLTAETAQPEEPPREEEPEELPEEQPQVTAAAPQTGDSVTLLSLSAVGLSLAALTWAKRLRADLED